MTGDPAPPRAAVIDDDPSMRRLVTTSLGTRGWRSEAFADARSARQTVEAHGGRIWVDAGPEGGAALHVVLPRLAVAAP